MRNEGKDGRMQDATDGSETQKRRGLQLWRLLPFAGALLLFAGNVRHGLAGHSDHDGGRTVFFALFLAGFVAIYGQPPLFGAGVATTAEARAARQRAFAFAATCVAGIALVAAALFSQAGWLGIWTPRSRADWELVALDLASIWLYALHFHALWSARRAGE